MKRLKRLIKKVPVIGSAARHVYRFIYRAGPAPAPLQFTGSSTEYWESRYASGRNSGGGSYSRLADFKAEILNAFVAGHAIQSVIEFGCGDGNQLSLAVYPRYIGLDVSKTIVEKCRQLFKADPSKSFELMADYAGEQADLALSLDVVFHLVEDDVFEAYMRTLFGASGTYVIVYSSNSAEIGGAGRHEKHRRFTDWVDANETGWKLVEHIPNRYPYAGDSATGSPADFFVYGRVGGGA
jgi:SAM-dependent methyltransferase